MKQLREFTIIMLLVVALFVAGMIFIPVFRKAPAASTQEQLQDSILYYSKKAQQHDDSARKYHEQGKTAYQKYITALVDTSRRDSLRAKLRADLRGKIRAELAGQPDSLRTAQTGHL